MDDGQSLKICFFQGQFYNVSEAGSFPSYLKTETDLVSETFMFLRKHWTVDKVHKPDSFKCNVPSSEPFRSKTVFALGMEELC
jgi:hypothetical protein